MKKKLQFGVAMAALLPFALLLTACSTPDNSASDSAAIRTADEQWSAAAENHDLNSALSFYASDAVVLPANAPIATDAKSIHDMLAPLFAPGGSLGWKVTKAEAAKSGDLGYVYGTYALTMPPANGAAGAHDTGKYVEVWRKQSDGKWKCIVDTFNSDLPAAH